MVPCPSLQLKNLLNFPSVHLTHRRNWSSKMNEEDIGFEPLALDATCTLQSAINQLTDVMYENDPDKNKALRPTMFWLRDEEHLMKDISLKIRQEALKDQIIREYEENKEALMRIGMGFISTHP